MESLSGAQSGAPEPLPGLASTGAAKKRSTENISQPWYVSVWHVPLPELTPPVELAAHGAPYTLRCHATSFVSRVTSMMPASCCPALTSYFDDQ